MRNRPSKKQILSAIRDARESRRNTPTVADVLALMHSRLSARYDRADLTERIRHYLAEVGA